VQNAVSEAAEPAPAQANEGNPHPLLKEWAARVETARAARNLAGVQSRANPELRLATTRDRAHAMDAWSQTITLGVRIPFGSDSRQRARVASAIADETEAEAQLAVERERVAAEVDTARQRAEAARAWLTAAEQRAWLANETRGFFEKSFRLGETDLPTRMRIEGEAAEAEREAARARVELAASVSALRQALGLLPE
jgi:cobalt-zinc-cadmium efflux system outer membrane protein